MGKPELRYAEGGISVSMFSLSDAELGALVKVMYRQLGMEIGEQSGLETVSLQVRRLVNAEG